MLEIEIPAAFASPTFPPVNTPDSTPPLILIYLSISGTLDRKCYGFQCFRGRFLLAAGSPLYTGAWDFPRIRKAKLLLAGRTIPNV